MSAKTATVWLYVTTVSLLSAILSLITALVRLMAAGVVRLTRAIERSTLAPAPTGDTEGMTIIHGERAVNMRKGQLGHREQLTSALCHLGFSTPAVRAYIATLDANADGRELETLIKDGLRALTAN